MSGVSKLRHVAAMNPAGRGSISTEEARDVLAELDAARARLAAQEPVVQAMRAYRDRLQLGDLARAIDALDAVPAAETGSDCTVTASCEEGDHSRTWPCDYAPGSGRLAR